MYQQGLIICFFLSALTAQNYEDCGRSKILGKEENGRAADGEFPYFCALFLDLDAYKPFLGGATLLQENQLLSLASLFVNLDLLAEDKGCLGYTPRFNILARCGSTDIQGKDHPNQQDRNIRTVHLHPGYSNRTLVNDFAILVTTEPFIYSDTVGRVCLPGAEESEKDYDGEHCVAVGHGMDGEVEDGSIYSVDLIMADLSLVDPTRCEDTLNTLHFGTPAGGSLGTWRLHSSHICAGGQGTEDTCTGDGGGPLLCKHFNIIDFLDLRTTELEENKYIQVGVTAWGVGCGKGLPGVYSRVSDAMCWIDQIMNCCPPNPPPKATTEEDDLLVDLRVFDSSPSIQSVNRVDEKDCATWKEEWAGRVCGCTPLPGDTPQPQIASALDFDIRVKE